MSSGAIMIGVRIGIAVVVLLLVPASARAETIFVEAGRDATLIEGPDGALANGSGPVFFVGRTNQSQNGVRRGVIYFDVAAALPGHARVESVRLTLYMSPSNAASHPVGLHRLLADWGEGSSFASGGGGDLEEGPERAVRLFSARALRGPPHRLVAEQDPPEVPVRPTRRTNS
jgi:hypothetical protein